MKITDKITAEPKKVIDIQEALIAWPDRYYKETDPSVRLEMLKAAIKAELDPENDSIRMEIFNQRYTPNEYADGGYADLFMRSFMNFNTTAKNTPGPFAAKRIRKNVLKELDSLGISRAESDERFRALLLDEFTHVGLLYIALSADSKQYTSLLFGFGRINEQALIRKLYNDLACAGIKVASTYDLMDEMALWLEGLEEARRRLLPSTDPFSSVIED